MEQKVTRTETEATQGKKRVGLIQVLLISLLLVIVALGGLMLVNTLGSPDEPTQPSQTTQ